MTPFNRNDLNWLKRAVRSHKEWRGAHHPKDHAEFDRDVARMRRALVKLTVLLTKPK